MAVQSKATLFQPELVADLFNKVKGKSSLAKLSKQVPIAFDGQQEFTFTMDSDIDVVAENGKKTHGGIKIEPLTILPIKVEYGARISDEFLYATEEHKIDILKAFNDGYAKKLARGFDIMGLHGLNPRSATASTVIGNNNFDSKIDQTVEFTQDNPDANIEAAVALVQAGENMVSGAAMDPAFSSALAAMRTGDTNNVRVFPDLAWGANPDTINGLPIDINTTVGVGKSDVAVIGDFANMFKWGYAKQIPLEVIQYGDPDNSGNDLKGYNQVYLRAETYLGWGIMDANSFTRVVKKPEA